MTRIIICDDEEIERKRIISLVKEYLNTSAIKNAEIIPFSSPHMVENEPCADVYLLDIIMPETTGLELCQKIRNTNPKAKVIFCTMSKEFALDAFNLRVIHYLIKPIEKLRLFAVLDEIFKKTEQKIIGVMTKKGLVSININEIAYVEYANHHLKYSLNDGNSILSVAGRRPFLQEAEIIVKEKNFIHSHNAYLVNIKNVKKYTTDSFIMKNGNTIPIAKLKRTYVKEQYLESISKMEE